MQSKEFMGMRLSLLSITIFTFLFLPCLRAQAVEVNGSVGIYYFTSNQEKVKAADVEIAEDGQAFPAPRDPRMVAQDFAQEEIQKGNVCLIQADRDLRRALRTHKITRMCREIFKDDISAALASARKGKWRADSLSCEASFEARETSAGMNVVLAFRSRLNWTELVPEKLARAGIKKDPRGWVFPVYEAPIGGAAAGWKGALESRACSLDREALTAYLDKFLEQAKEARVRALCKRRLGEQVELLHRLQAQFKQYVPDDWLTSAAGKKSAVLLQPRAAPAEGIILETCRKERVLAGEQLDDLRDVSAKIARKRNLPALDPKNQPLKKDPATDDLDQ